MIAEKFQTQEACRALCHSQDVKNKDQKDGSAGKRTCPQS